MQNQENLKEHTRLLPLPPSNGKEVLGNSENGLDVAKTYLNC
jgi:hypothetical protein